MTQSYFSTQKEASGALCVTASHEVGARELPRFGTIEEIIVEQGCVKVMYDASPAPISALARLGRGFSLEELTLALQNKLTCRIEFIDGDINLPLVTDIFFSLIDNRDTLVLKAKKIQIEAEQELTLGSQGVTTRYSGRDQRITTEAKYITSQAEKANQIRGASISLN
ncbi:hypothetical protein [Thaumasiovibrio sp. DFM-14]|uniref:hypothetical protein n=1 Tax=Thaumasiovibrio sp. DFM-14 TaxID=3384792 RepID=UPI0039A0C426